MSDKKKKRARELQALGEGVISYQACLNLFLEHGFEEAKVRVLEMKKNTSPGALGGRR
jgi:hypothetical protein